MKWNGNPKEQRAAMILTSIGEKLKRNAVEFFSGETCQSVEMNRNELAVQGSVRSFYHDVATGAETTD